LGGATYKDLGYLRGDPREEKIKKLFGQLRSLGVEVHSHTHQTIQQAKRRVKVDDSGIVLE
jgi:hypothetical protein